MPSGSAGTAPDRKYFCAKTNVLLNFCIMRFNPTLLFFLFSFCCWFGLSAQTVDYTFSWDAEPLVLNDNGQRLEIWSFPGASARDDAPTLPIWIHRQAGIPGDYTVEVVRVEWEDFPSSPAIAQELLTRSLSFTTQSGRDADGTYVKIGCVPIIQTASGPRRVHSFSLRLVRNGNSNVVTSRGPTNTTLSALSDGDIYKLAVPKDGVYRLSYSFLKNDLGISNLDQIDPRTIQLFGNGGGRLPYLSSNERPDDLIENPVFVSGESDGSFDSGDFILFYGQAANVWNYDAGVNTFDYQVNIYDTQNYYFIKIGGGTGARIENRASVGSTTYDTDSYDYLAQYEEERVNIMHELESPSGCSQRWYSDYFKIARDKTYTSLFNVPDFVNGETATLRGRMALRCNISSRYTISVNGNTASSESASAIQSMDTGNEAASGKWADDADAALNFPLTGASVDVQLAYPFPAGARGSEGWLDYLQLRARRRLVVGNQQMLFRDTRGVTAASNTYRLTTIAPAEVWDITNPVAPVRQTTTGSGNTIQFGAAAGGLLHEFIAFPTNGTFQTATAIGKIDNQNLHGLTEADVLILYHPDLKAPAEKLAQHRSDFSNLSVQVVDINQVYNEFSGGSVDPTAIRDMGYMLFERAPERFRFLLLMGDGSFDERDIYGLGTDLIPVFENDSHSEINGFPADDYFAIYSVSTNTNPLAPDLSVSVGRIPARTAVDADRIVDKIIDYEKSPAGLGDWRNRMIFLADDEDNAVHARDADEAATLAGSDRDFNLTKLYFDLYPQESTPGGERYPTVTEELNRGIFRGASVVTYMGHGGPKGWAQERVLSVPDIRSWRNKDRLPIFITATCTFAGFDDPNFVSAGEEIILLRDAGASALLTTTRPVYVNGNSLLTNNAVTNLIAREANGDIPRIGDVIRRAKNAINSGGDVNNARKFALLGDPAMRVAFARYNVQTTSINGQAVTVARQDTLRALQRITISGIVTDDAGATLTNFNGIVYPTIFDKAVRRTTLQQDPTSSERSFTIQKNVIFKGRASVVNGAFTFSFVAPRDIDLSFGQGKISYYAADAAQLIDAAGYYDGLTIGGTDPNALADDQGPEVEVYLNTEEFIFGGTTSPNPTLLVKLRDDNGINVAGNSIGHDLEGVLDEDSRNTLLLNEFYEAAVDDYTQGEVRFPLENLTPGLHRISVKAWDVANNSAEGYTEFIVANDGRIALERVLNYPNPFTDRTCFQFDHNLAGQDLDVMVQIYTVSGRLVKTLQQQVNNDGGLRTGDCLEWDGRDDFGDQLARGVYLYRVNVRVVGANSELTAESDFEKLVILK